MRARLLVTLCIGVLIGALLSACVRQPTAQAQRPDGAQRWEYKMVARGPIDAPDLEKKRLERFNEAGNDGWELVLFTEFSSGAIFKRPKK
jgi:hypothetical protein